MARNKRRAPTNLGQSSKRSRLSMYDVENTPPRRREIYDLQATDSEDYIVSDDEEQTEAEDGDDDVFSSQEPSKSQSSRHHKRHNSRSTTKKATSRPREKSSRSRTPPQKPARDTIKSNVLTINSLLPARPNQPNERVSLSLSDHFTFDEWNARSAHTPLPPETRKTLSFKWIEKCVFHRGCPNWKVVLEEVGVCDSNRRRVANALIDKLHKGELWNPITEDDINEATEFYLALALDRVTNFFKRFMAICGRKGQLWDFQQAQASSGCYITEAGKERICLENVVDGELVDRTRVPGSKAPDLVIHDLRSAVHNWTPEQTKEFIADVFTLTRPVLKQELTIDEMTRVKASFLSMQKRRFRQIQFTGNFDDDMQRLREVNSKVDENLATDVRGFIDEQNQHSLEQYRPIASLLTDELVQLCQMDTSLQANVAACFGRNGMTLLDPNETQQERSRRIVEEYQRQQLEALNENQDVNSNNSDLEAEVHANKGRDIRVDPRDAAEDDNDGEDREFQRHHPGDVVGDDLLSKFA